MPRIALALAAALLVAAAAPAQEDFEARVFKAADGGTLPYRLLRPLDYDRKRAYPLVIFLHGAGERGNDNERQMNYFGPLIAKPENRAAYPCIAILPQCPGDRRWCEVDWSDPKPHQTPAEPSVPMRQLLELLPTLTREFSVDPDRVYVTGLSMGGFGTWDLITRHPEIFAAAAPICGGADNSAAPRLIGLPIHIYHGDADTTVPTIRSRSMAEALTKAGSTQVVYTEYPGVGHDAWNKAFADPEFLKWLFAQKRAHPGKKKGK